MQLFSELERLVALEPKALKLAVTEWLETMYADNDCPLLVAELQLHARRSQDFAKQYYALQERQAQTLASILERYFKALSKRSPIAPIDLARSLLALAQGLILQHPPSKPGTPNSSGRVIDSMLKIRFTNVVDLFRLMSEIRTPYGLSDREFDSLFTRNQPVIFNFHAHASPEGV